MLLLPGQTCTGRMDNAVDRAQSERPVTIDKVGAFLASDSASGVIGTLTDIDGGRHVRP